MIIANPDKTDMLVDVLTTLWEAGDITIHALDPDTHVWLASIPLHTELDF